MNLIEMEELKNKIDKIDSNKRLYKEKINNLEKIYK